MTGLKVPGQKSQKAAPSHLAAPFAIPLSHSIWNKNSLGVSLTHLEIT